jgi:hypothetical protein
MKSTLAQRLRGAVAKIARQAGVRPMAGAAVESWDDLSARYMGSLRELVDDGHISPSAAQTVIDDLFEPEQPGIARRLRLAVWRADVQERTGSIERWPVVPDRESAGPI